MISIKDKGGVRAVRERYAKAVILLNGAAQRAVNKSIQGARTDADRLLGSMLTMKMKDRRAGMTTMNAGGSRTAAELRIYNRPPILSRYQHSGGKRQKGIRVAARTPARVRVRRDGPMHPLRRGFVFRGRGGTELIAWRSSRGRWGVKILRGPGIGAYFQHGRMREALEKAALNRMVTNMAHEVSRGLTELGR